MQKFPFSFYAGLCQTWASGNFSRDMGTLELIGVTFDTVYFDLCLSLA